MKFEEHALTHVTAARLEALKHYAIFGTPPEAAFDRIVQMVGKLFGVASVHINFLDDCTQSSKAFYGTDASGLGLEHSFCAQAILQNDVFVVLDALSDPQFQDNPLVTGGMGRFYASAVLMSQNGVNIGTLCLTDPEPRNAFSAHERALLQNFAAIVMDELELRNSVRALAQVKTELQGAHTALAEQLTKLAETSLVLQKLNQRLQHDATHDALTGLPNRTYFLARLAHALGGVHTPPFALLFLDFDRFKLINDSLGHAVGDGVLRTLSLRLRHHLKEGDVLARFGGDEFSVLLYNVTAAEAVAAAERLKEHFSHPVNLGERKVQLGVSIGVVRSAGDYEKPEEMLQDADIAMYSAKAQGKKSDQGTVVLFETSMRAGVIARLSLEDELREALRQKQLQVYYQPIVGAAGTPVGVEALVRWLHPERGFVSPAEFIPIAEESGLIIPLERFVLEEAVQSVAAWNRRGATLWLSVNLSSRHFGRPELVRFVESVLKRSGLAPENLVLELTESTLLESSDTLYQTLARLKALGPKLALDDFGTGYSSLSYLQRVPLDLLKIDRSFVSQMSHTHKSVELVKTILAMAQALELAVVAEGVETEAQRSTLRALGCPYLQGFLFARPLPAEETEALLYSGVYAGETLSETFRETPAKRSGKTLNAL